MFLQNSIKMHNPKFSYDPQISCGTTTLAAEFDGGVILAADSRTSCNTYASNRMADKLTRITDMIYCCRSGAAAHTQALSEVVSHALYTLEINSGRPALVRDAAMQFRNRIYKLRDHIMASVIVAGWDWLEGGQVYSVPPSGVLIRESCAVAGSGSTFIQGYVADNYVVNMTEDQCICFAKKAINLAIGNDTHSGGIIRYGIINKDGYKSCAEPRNAGDLSLITNTMLWNLEFND